MVAGLAIHCWDREQGILSPHSCVRLWGQGIKMGASEALLASGKFLSPPVSLLLAHDRGNVLSLQLHVASIHVSVWSWLLD